MKTMLQYSVEAIKELQAAHDSVHAAAYNLPEEMQGDVYFNQLLKINRTLVRCMGKLQKINREYNELTPEGFAI